MASAPSPPSIRSSRRESAHTSSLAREQRKGKEVIRLTPDATSGHGHRQAPVRRWHPSQNPQRSDAADVRRYKTPPLPATKRKENKLTGSPPMVKYALSYTTLFRRRWHRRQVPHRSVAADVSRLILHPWPASKGREKK